ncbi:MAG: RHS repeat protein [Pirellulaceae bacterium]|nr:RHS repeat protein [Pirellulaceae bacterium]
MVEKVSGTFMVSQAIWLATGKEGALFASCGLDGGITQFTYDDAGNLPTIKDPVNHTTSQSYDGVGRMTMETNQLKTLAQTTQRRQPSTATWRLPFGRRPCPDELLDNKPRLSKSFP